MERARGVTPVTVAGVGVRIYEARDDDLSENVDLEDAWNVGAQNAYFHDSTVLNNQHSLLDRWPTDGVDGRANECGALRLRHR